MNKENKRDVFGYAILTSMFPLSLLVFYFELNVGLIGVICLGCFVLGSNVLSRKKT